MPASGAVLSAVAKLHSVCLVDSAPREKLAYNIGSNIPVLLPMLEHRGLCACYNSEHQLRSITLLHQTSCLPSSKVVMGSIVPNMCIGKD